MNEKTAADFYKNKLMQLETEMFRDITILEYEELEKLQDEVVKHQYEIRKLIESIITIKHYKFIDKSCSFQVDLEEIVKLNTYYRPLQYNINIIREGLKEVILIDLTPSSIYQFNIDDKSCYIKSILENKKFITRIEKEAIYAYIFKNKESVLLREQQVLVEVGKSFLKNDENIFLIENKDNLKKFYRILAKNIHPDNGGSNEMMHVLDRIKEMWKV